MWRSISATFFNLLLGFRRPLCEIGRVFKEISVSELGFFPKANGDSPSFFFFSVDFSGHNCKLTWYRVDLLCKGMKSDHNAQSVVWPFWYQAHWCHVQWVVPNGLLGFLLPAHWPPVPSHVSTIECWAFSLFTLFEWLIEPDPWMCSCDPQVLGFFKIFLLTIDSILIGWDGPPFRRFCLFQQKWNRIGEASLVDNLADACN